MVSDHKTPAQPKWQWQVQFPPHYIGKETETQRCWIIFTVHENIEAGILTEVGLIHTFHLYRLLPSPRHIRKDSEKMILELNLKRKIRIAHLWFSGSLSAQSKQRGMGSSLEIITPGEALAPV